MRASTGFGIGRVSWRGATALGFGILASLLIPVMAARPLAASDGPAPVGTGEAVVLPGRVIARETGQPVAGAVVEVEQRGAAKSIERLTTDSDGRFAVRVEPPSRGAPVRLVLTVRHPGFIAVTGGFSMLTDVIETARRSEPTFFDTIRLESGVEYTGVIARSDGSPAAGQEVQFQNWGWTYYPRDTSLSGENKARTDAAGRFRLRMWKTKALEVVVMPDDLAPLRRFIGFADRGDDHPDYWVPADLGRFALEDGPRVSGRLLDREGRPIAGERLAIRGRIDPQLERKATTGPDGSFAFAPLPPGSFTVMADRQGHGASIDYDLPPLPPPSRAIGPVKVVLKSGARSVTVELRELETVAVTCRFVNSSGRPVAGAPISLSGAMLGGGSGPDPPGGRLASAVNEPEPDDPSPHLYWGVQAVPDADGRVVFRAPKGLVEPTLQTFPPDRTTSLRTRLRDGEPLKFWGGGRFGLELVADVPAVTVICYRAPTVLATVEAEGGPVPREAQVRASFIGPNGGSFGGQFERLGDGRFLSESLMPDHEYEITAGCRDYLWAKVRGIKLPEGGHADVRLTLRKRPAPARVGDLAPEINVPGLDGQPFRLSDYRGKFVLLDLWRMWEGPQEGDLPFLKAVRLRHADDPQFVVLGLSGGPRRADAEKVAAKDEIRWLRAVLTHDDGESPTPVSYGADGRSNVILIGPDGRILATDLHGPAIDGTLARFLAP